MENHYFHTEDLAVGYHGACVAEEIRIWGDRGRILTLIGPNGAGKSTILKTLAGLLPTVQGTVWLDGKRLEQIPKKELAKKIAVVFTEKPSGEFLTCREVVEAGRYPYTGRFGLLSARDKEAVSEAMELVAVSDLADRSFDCLSDGQRQRVMLARAVCQEPQMLLLDEPTSHLDIKYKLEFLTILREMAGKKQISVVMSLHELDLAERVSDMLACVRNGRVERFDTPENIFVPGYMEQLFGMLEGSFDVGSGTAEFSAVRGEPKVFVIAGGGTGKQTFWRLQRERIPFAVGILSENDVDYPTANATALHVVREAAGEPDRAGEQNQAGEPDRAGEQDYAGEPDRAGGQDQAGEQNHAGEQDQAGQRTPGALLKEARQWIDRCDHVICCGDRAVQANKYNKELFRYACKVGKLAEK